MPTSLIFQLQWCYNIVFRTSCGPARARGESLETETKAPSTPSTVDLELLFMRLPIRTGGLPAG